MLDPFKWTYQVSLRAALRVLCCKERYRKAFEIARSLPGIGWFTAIRLVLELGEDLSHFTSGKKIASFVGLTCSEYSTGETEWKGRITGIGSKLAVRCDRMVIHRASMEAKYPVLMEAVEHARQRVLYRCTGRGHSAIRNTGYIQHRPGEPVYLGGIHGHSFSERHKDQHGRQRPLDGQHLHREALEDRQVRGDIYLKAYSSIADVRKGLKVYFERYNSRRRHQGLNDRTPDEVYWATLRKAKEAVETQAAKTLKNPWRLSERS